MGLFGLLGSVTKAVVNTATLPLSAAVDLATIDDRRTRENSERLDNNIKKILKELDDKEK